MESANTAMAKDGRRKHAHWRVTLTYFDKEVFGRVYIDQEKAKKFASRQTKSPLVKSAHIERIS
ncbi:MAG: hypothetical protein NVS9B14_19950 [Candidatus Acidiferrum sp.]